LTIPEVFLNLRKLYNGRIYDVDKVVNRSCQKMAAISDERVLLEVDGEQPGMLPVVAKILPEVLDIIAN
jgi:diacylglycerol kinase family enzyme